MAKSNERIILGSGDVYIAEFTGTAPTVAALKTPENKFGATKNGASLEYSCETYDTKSDDGTLTKTIYTEETVTLNLGTCGVMYDKIPQIISTARVTEDTTNKKTVVKIGGLANDNGKSYAVLFYQTDKQDGDIAVMIVGKNKNGASFSFKKDGETILEPQFKADAQDDDGTLVTVEFYDTDATVTPTQTETQSASKSKAVSQ